MWSAEKLRCVMARCSRDGSEKACCRRSCRAERLGETKTEKKGRKGSVGLLVEAVHEVGGADERDLSRVAEGDHDLVVALRHFEVLAGDGADVVDGSCPVEGGPDLRHRGRLARSLGSRLADGLVLQEDGHGLAADGEGGHREHGEEHQADEGQAALAGSPDRPRGVRCGARQVVLMQTHGPDPLLSFRYVLGLAAVRGKPLLETADALQVAEIHPHEKGLADDVRVRHEAPIA